MSIKRSDYVIQALCQSEDSFKEKNIRRQKFIKAYFDKPIIAEDFTPLQKEKLYAR